MKVKIGNATLHLGDCLEVMPSMQGASFDAVVCDLPYGTTKCDWDSIVPLDLLWAQYTRITKPCAAIVLTASQPFTTALIASNLDDFRYCMVWEKSRPSNPLSAKKQPLRAHEDVCVFYRAQPTYNPQMTQGKPNHATKAGKAKMEIIEWSSNYHVNTSSTKHPRSVIQIASTNNTKNLHPTQKPVALLEYLIRTYTNADDVVLDSCMGSGTTGVACALTGRAFIGIEREPKYFDIACRRIEQAYAQGQLFAPAQPKPEQLGIEC